MRCTNCGYFYKEDCETYAMCHFDGPDYWAPCEQDDVEYENNELED